MLLTACVLGTNKGKKRGKKCVSAWNKNFVELFNFFTNHHPIRHLCTIFRVLFVYESNAHRAILSKNDLNQTMTTHNDTTTNHSKNISTTHQRRIPQQGTIQHHTKPCIQQHDQQHTEQSTYQTTYQRAYEQHTIHHTIQQTKDHTTINQWAYPMIYQKTFQTYQTIWQTEQLANHTTINHLGLRKVVAISKKVATMQSLESLLFSCIFLFFCARSVWMYDPSEFSVYRGIV